MAQMMYNALVDSKAKLPSYDEYSEVALGINDFIDCDNDEAVAVCYALKLLSGSGGYFNPHDPMTRAQAAVVLCNVYDAVRGSGSGLSPEQPVGPIEAPDSIHIYDGGKMIGFRPKVHNEVEDNAQCDCKFYFSIEPKEDYSGVIMPDDTTVMIEGTGDASFDEIRFTEPGTYSFVISEEEGMDNYRNDTRTWEVTVTVSGTAGAPVGAVGGQYDVSAHDVPADTNKDGWITESEVQAVLDQLKIEYPEGSPWGLNTRYPGRPDGQGMGAGTACAGFARMVSDSIFGTLPKYAVSIDKLRIGDVLVNNAAKHDNVCIQTYYRASSGAMITSKYLTVNGNSGGTVVWEQQEKYADWPTSITDGVIYSRYPLG